MKTTIFALIFISAFTFTLFANPGDTVFVKTFTFDSINSRRGNFPFPAEQSWEKIMMYYTIKCDAATPWDSYACGEWDYTTYTNVYEHTGELDSVQYNHKKYTLNNNGFSVFNGTLTPKYHKYAGQYTQNTYNFTGQNDYTAGTAQTTTNFGITAGAPDSKTYLLYSAPDLISAGLVAGEINQISFSPSAVTPFSTHITVQSALAGLTEINLADVKDLSFTENYRGIITHSSGEITIPLTVPLTWDGSSSLIFAVSCTSFGDIVTLDAENKTAPCVLQSSGKDYFINFENYSYIDIPSQTVATLNNEITVSLWVYGNEAMQPQNDMLIEAVDENGQRQLCIHYPWGNGSIYWDAGNDGTGYDRIDKAATETEYKGRWNHVAFTKNALTGSMKIYINGVLWHSGTGKTKPVQNISTFILGCNVNKENNYSYDGYIDDFSIWNKELSVSEIQQLMYNKPGDTFSAWDNLLVYYDFDENPGSGNVINDYSENTSGAFFLGTLNRMSYQGINRFKNFETDQKLPVLKLTNGEYTVESNTFNYVDSVMLNQQIIREFNNLDFYTIQCIDTAVYFPDYELFTNLTNDTDTSFFTADISLVNSDLAYFGQAYEVVNTIQLQNYVTPYGIGLNLGSDGFTHAYDVTDYAQYLKNTVDLSAHNTQELIDVTFAFIEGTPPRNVVQFDQVYLGNFGQYNIANDISLKPIKIKRNPAATMFNVKTRTTGHGMAGDGNCSEFCPTWHNISVEGTQTNEWYNWTSCAGNPIFPQGGTWIFDRAGWCPGSFADTYDWEITTFVTDPDSVELDYGMTQYGVGAGEGNYNVSMQLVQYSDPNFANDVAIEAVTAPNNADLYKRYNPVCKNPEIIIKNTGSNELQSVLIEYGLNGDYSYSYQWTGELDFLETETVLLPVIPWQEFVEFNDFNVRVSLPNQEEDEYPANNTFKTRFNTVDIWTVPNILVVRTNNFGNETSYTVTDSGGNILVDRHDLASNTTYYDTLDFAPGCYDIRLYDTGEDGFDFWYYNGADGTGYMKLRKTGAGYVKNFPLDFGSFIYYQFVIPDVTYIANEEINKEYFEIFPNPNDGNFKLKLNFEPEENSVITITDMSGRTVLKLTGDRLNAEEININLDGISKGFYLINLQTGKILRTGKLVVE